MEVAGSGWSGGGDRYNQGRHAGGLACPARERPERREPDRASGGVVIEDFDAPLPEEILEAVEGRGAARNTASCDGSPTTSGCLT